MKETQGSVEVTSFGQMKNILCYGCYTVGGEQGKTVHSIHDIIHLKLEGGDKQLSKKSYSLDELRDLESKLVLITGSKAENRAEMEQFLDVGYRRTYIYFACQMHFLYSIHVLIFSFDRHFTAYVALRRS